MRHRKELAPHQGQLRKTWLQAILIGDIAIVGVPGEFFTVLGQEIKRRSPFRYTYVFELANDYIGYIPIALPSALVDTRPGQDFIAFSSPEPARPSLRNQSSFSIGSMRCPSPVPHIEEQ